MGLSSEPSSPFEKEKKRLRRAIQKKINRIQKGLLHKTAALEKSKQHEEFQHIADILKSHFHLIKPRMEMITLQDWQNDNRPITIPLNPTLSPEAQVKNAYKQVKKLRRAQEPLEKAISHLHKALENWQHCLTLLLQCETEFALKELQKNYAICQVHTAQPAAQAKTSHVETPHRFFSASGYTILVGKNAAQNNHLTFQLARSEDLWLHAHQVAGSHVLIKKDNSKASIDYETLLDAAHLALYFSKGRSFLNKEQEVVITERRYVQRIKKAALGKVSISQYKTLVILLDPKRIEELKKRLKK